MSLSALTESIFEFRRFLQRYQRLFRYKSQRRHFEVCLRGLVGPLERKSIEPIALDQGVDWHRLQDFVGSSPWDAEAILREHRRHLSQSLGSPRGVIIIDPTSFPKRGDKSIGVAKQWCGQLGKKENCVVGVFLAYASEQGHTFLDRRLYLPEGWSEDRVRRRTAGVPPQVVYRSSGELAYEMISKVRREGIPHSWITGDEEFGQLPWLQDWLDQDGERYILEAPCHHRVWVTLPRPSKRDPRGLSARLRILGPGRPRLVRMDRLARDLPPKAWTAHDVRDGSKGPIRVRAALLRIRFHRSRKEARRAGWLMITQTLDQQRQVKYFHSNASADARIEELLSAGFARWPVEQCHGQGKNETGLGDYETRSWPGWHHHTALTILAHHWLVLERNRLGEKIPRDDRGGSTPYLLYRFQNGTRTVAQAPPPNAASPSPEPGRAALALEKSSGSSSDARAPLPHRPWPHQLDHHSHAEIKTGQYH